MEAVRGLVWIFSGIAQSPAPLIPSGMVVLPLKSFLHHFFFFFEELCYKEILDFRAKKEEDAMQTG